jgi:hypothetical protein
MSLLRLKLRKGTRVETALKKSAVFFRDAILSNSFDFYLDETMEFRTEVEA